jgi:hypothetical protein
MAPTRGSTPWLQRPVRAETWATAPVAQGDLGAGQQGEGQRAATCANVSIPSPHHRVRTAPLERSTRSPCSSPPAPLFPRRVGLIASEVVLLVWFFLHSKVGSERCLVDLRPFSVPAGGLGVPGAFRTDVVMAEPIPTTQATPRSSTLSRAPTRARSISAIT